MKLFFKTSKKPLLIWLGGVVCGFLLMFIPYLVFENPEEERNTLLNTRFTNPYLECTGVADSDPLLVRAKKKLKKYIITAQKKDPSLKVSVYVRDLNNGPWIGIDEKINFSPASLMKIPVLMYHLNVADENRQHFNKTTIYEPEKMISEDNLIDFIGKKQHLVPAKEYTIKELIERMIVYSDNHSADLLYLMIDESRYNQIFQDLQFVHNFENGKPVISTKNYSSIFRVLYNADFIGRELSEYALELLSRTAYQQGIAKYIPENIPVSAKFGIYNYNNPMGPAVQVHDCGIIYQLESPYLMCVMTSSANSDLLKQSEIIGQLSKIVFEGKTE